MKFLERLSLTRREFIRNMTATGVTIPAAGSVLVSSTAQGGAADGKKGKMYPSQRKSHKDAKSGRTVWQLTDTPGRTTQTLYFTNRHATLDSRWLVYASDRGSQAGKFNLFKMDLRSGESIQLTESGAVVAHTPDISRDGKEVFYVEHSNSLRSVDLESLKERELCRFDENVDGDHAISISADNKLLVWAPLLERRIKRGYEYADIAVRSALILIRTDNGQQRRPVDGMSPLGHVAFSPTDPNLILYSIHGHWNQVQRPWLVKTDGTGHRKILPVSQGEGVGHEFWGASGRTVYASCYGGRHPQGIWASDIDGSNERCVLAGATIAHGAASHAEDRFTADEMYGDSTTIWISQKGSPEPVILCKMAQDWFKTLPDGNRQATPHHPHSRFLPNGTGLTFSSGGEIYLVEL